MIAFLRGIFALSLGLLVYTYFLYPLLAGLLARVFGRPPRRAPHTPSVTLLIPAFNEEAHIRAKIENSLALDYPKENLRIVVASDGSTDATNAIVEEYREQGVELIALPENRGKAVLLNTALPRLQGELIALSDASGLLDRHALRVIVENFADPAIGCVSGLYRLQRGGSMRDEGEGLYWRYETWIKQQESLLHSILGAHGAFYVIRKDIFKPLDPRAVNDDYIIAMRAIEAGYRSIYDARACCVERELASVEGEFARRRRIAVGNCQQIATLRHLLHPRFGWVAFSFFSHKVLRTAAPYFMIGVFLTTFAHPPGQRALWLLLQGLFYGAAWAGYHLQQRGKRLRLLSPVLYFCLGNLAMLAGSWRYFRRPGAHAWERAR